MVTLIIFLIIFAIVKYNNLQLDTTREGDLILWYGRRNRKFIFIDKKQ